MPCKKTANVQEFKVDLFALIDKIAVLSPEKQRKVSFKVKQVKNRLGHEEQCNV